MHSVDVGDVALYAHPLPRAEVISDDSPGAKEQPQTICGETT